MINIERDREKLELLHWNNTTLYETFLWCLLAGHVFLLENIENYESYQENCKSNFENYIASVYKSAGRLSIEVPTSRI